MTEAEMTTYRARLARLLKDQEQQTATVERVRSVAGAMPSTRQLLAENTAALRWALQLIDAQIAAQHTAPPVGTAPGGEGA